MKMRANFNPIGYGRHFALPTDLKSTEMKWHKDLSDPKVYIWKALYLDDEHRRKYSRIYRMTRKEMLREFEYSSAWCYDFYPKRIGIVG